jgi:DNA-binding beta-propeller fold protein YncE
VFSKSGPQRYFDFDHAYKNAFDAAIAQPERPIYLEDGFWGPAYIHGLWYSVVEGINRSEFVHLAEGEAAPSGSVVLSSNNTCLRCDVLSRNGSFMLYKMSDHEGLVDLTANKPPAETPLPEAPPAKPPEKRFVAQVFSPELLKPHGIVADAAGNTYIADSAHSRVLKLSPNGETIGSLGQADGDGALSQPTGVAIDAGGDVFVVDATKKMLVKFKPDGGFIRQWGSPDLDLDVPWDIAVGSDKLLYITDVGRSRIVKFNPATGDSSVWGNHGTGDGEFDMLNGITISGDHVYAADAKNDRIEVFDLNGSYISQWRVPQWANYIWHRPDVAIDQKANVVYVTSGWTHEVLMFDMSGTFIGPLKPEAPALYNNPTSIFLSDTKRGKFLYVLNTGTDVVESGPSSVMIFDLSDAKK